MEGLKPRRRNRGAKAPKTLLRLLLSPALKGWAIEKIPVHGAHIPIIRQRLFATDAGFVLIGTVLPDFLFPGLEGYLP
jgi:hypothetical protein